MFPVQLKSAGAKGINNLVGRRAIICLLPTSIPGHSAFIYSCGLGHGDAKFGSGGAPWQHEGSERWYFGGSHVRWGTGWYRGVVTGKTSIDVFFKGDSCFGLNSTRGALLQIFYLGDSGLL
jgi:hypothetical protein